MARRVATRQPTPHEPAERDLYALLEISPSARVEVIQAAYKVLVRTWHPDVNSSPEASQRIRDLNAAYGVLSDPQLRAGYDLQRARSRRRAQLLGQDAAERGQAPSDKNSGVFALSSRRANAVRLTPEPASLSHVVLLAAAVTAVVAAMLLLVWVGIVLAEDPPTPVPTSIIDVQMHDR